MKKELVLIPFVVLLACGSMGSAQDPAPVELFGRDGLVGQLGRLGSAGALELGGLVDLDRHLELLGPIRSHGLLELPGALVPVEEDRLRPGRKCQVEMPIRDALAAPLVLDETSRAGLVRWHPTLEAAEFSAQASGRPVLLFQLLGKLDEEFC